MNIQSFLNLSGPVKAIIAACTGASLIGVIYIAASGNTTMLYLLGVIVVVIAILVGLYALILKLGKSKKARKMDRAIQQHNTASPSSVSGADARVKLDDLRQRFQAGIMQYKKHGKDLYSIPWYVIIGEPGSGKTEAIRRSGVGFPPNLQDEQQGIGGTINMNWWFTDKGVILDTAGRLLFEEVVAGSTSEWKEFLALLRKSRPDCPINGLILAIPTDSLIKDNSATIETKAKRIAVQLDEIQRILDIRFPVFVLITKSDLIPGFREFFKDLQEPDLEHQMVGWSNPSPLDAPFSPQQVDEYLSGLIKSIENRRYPLMREPDHTGIDHGERWMDQMDEIYNFPQALEQLFPRLRRFLELIFVAGEWAQKPLFLRGIYITSSLQEGAVLDQELASALGIEVQDLPEEISFIRKGALFLRDVYMEKIFREKSLVTRASNAGGVVRSRQLLVFGIGFLAMAASFGLAWISASTLKSSIGKQQDFWEVAASDRLWNGDRWRLPIVEDSPVQEGFISNEDKMISVKSDQIPYMDFLSRLVEFTKEEIKTPLIFKPVEWVSSGLTSREIDRLKALKALYEAGVLWPLIVGTHDEFELPDAKWTPQARDALMALIRLERQIAEANDGQKPSFEESREIVPVLMQYLTGKPGDPRLLDAADWIFLNAPDASENWPPLWASGGNSLAANRAIRSAVEKFIGYVKEKSATQQDNLTLIESMLARLAEFDTAEKAFLEIVANMDSAAPGASIGEAQQILQSRMLPALQEISRQKASVIERGVLNNEEAFLLAVAYERELASARDTIQSTISEIQSELPETEKLAGLAGNAGDQGQFTLFNDIMNRLESARTEIAQVVASALDPQQVGQLKFYDEEFLAPNASMRPALDARAAIYSGLVGLFTSSGIERNPVGHLAERIQAYKDLVAQVSGASDYQGPREVRLKQVSTKLLSLFKTEYAKRLAAEYQQAMNDLVKQIRFPLVLPVTGNGLTQEELKQVVASLKAIDRDMNAASLEIFSPSDVEVLTGIHKRLVPVKQLGESLTQAGSEPVMIEVSLPGQEVQNEVLQKVLGVNAGAHINFKWESVRLNNDTSVRTRRPTGEVLGKVSLDSPELKLSFYRLNTEDPDPITFSGGWAPLQWLLSSRTGESIAGKDFNLLVQRVDAEVTYSMIVSLKFPNALPPLDQWPTQENILNSK